MFKIYVEQFYSKHTIIQVTLIKSREKINKAHNLIKAHCKKIKDLYFINTIPAFLDDNRKPKSGWFINNQLYLNKEEYKVWNYIIKSEIKNVS